MDQHAPIRLAVCGGFGHAGAVMAELSAQTSVPVKPVGVCPAYRGEPIENFSDHPWMKAHRAPRFARLAEVLDCHPNLLIISTRPDRIPCAALAGLEAGCHLISEKPLALKSADLRHIHRLACAQNLQIMGMLSMRSLPAFVAARKTVLDGTIGQPVLINTRKSYKWGHRPAWFNIPAKYGGTWPWIGIHCLDMAHFVTGLLPRTVTALQANRAHPEMENCDDTAAAVFEMANDATMTASIDLCRPGSAPTHGDDWIRVVGTKGVLEANASTGSLLIVSESGCGEHSFLHEAPARIYTPFLASLKSPRPPDSLLFDLTTAALAARQSARTGRRIALQPQF